MPSNVNPAETSFLDKFSQPDFWKDGYFEGDPLDPMGRSGYGVYGYNSILYTVYSACIRPYITAETTALEIGPSRGAWTKAILKRGCRKVYAVDAAPPEHTGFWKYIGPDPRAEYIVVHDFELAEIPDNSIDFFFSFGVFCHLRPQMCEQYVASIARKMRRGGRGFLMVADFDKYARCLAQADRLTLARFFSARGAVWLPARLAYLATATAARLSQLPTGNLTDAAPRDRIRAIIDGAGGKVGFIPESEKESLSPGTWYHWGLDSACEAIRSAGLTVIEPDIEVIPRDPMIHFMRS